MLRNLVLIVSLIFSTFALAGPVFAEADHCDEQAIEQAMLDVDQGHQHNQEHNCDCSCALQHLQCHSLKASVQSEDLAWGQWSFDQTAHFEATTFKDSPYLEGLWQPPRNA